MIFFKIDWLVSWNNFYRDSEFYKSKTWILTSLIFSLIHSIPEKCRMLWWSLGTNFPVWTRLHCAKRVRIWSYSGPYFPAFGLNTERGLHAFFIDNTFISSFRLKFGKTQDKQQPEDELPLFTFFIHVIIQKL